MEWMLTVDVEDWFQVENLKDLVQGQWDDKELRVENSTCKILDLLDEKNSKATFFVLGWIGERFPNLVKEIARRGHEVASHGYEHELVYNLNPEEFRQDIKKSKKLLEDTIGKAVSGYRAPSFSITDWAVDVLKEEGFVYDSSYFDFKMNRYGSLDMSKAIKVAEKNIYRLENGLHEIPATTLSMLGRNLPWGGGGYFRLIPLRLFMKGFERAVMQKGASMFYMHPWEVDPGQPRLSGLKKNYAFRHYYGLEHTLNKLSRMLDKTAARKTLHQQV